ncbi:MAG TPA: hypothetical protein VGL06_05630 [Pseudonocardiaceae bacterium]|jgi:hypothetical protein
MDTVLARAEPEINLTVVAAVVAWLLLVVLGRNRAAKDHQQYRRPMARV